MNEKNKSNKIKIIICSIAAVIIIIILILLLTLGVLNRKNTPEKQVEKTLKNMAKNFYEDLYYPNLENGNDKKRTDFLSKFDKIGIKVNFENLSKFNTKQNEKYIKIIEKYNCDKYGTKVIIKPTEKYKKTDYIIIVETNCNFNKKNDKK